MSSNSAVPSGRSVHSGTKADSQNTYDTDLEVPPTAMELRAKERHAGGVESTVPHSAVKDNQRQLPYDTDLGPTAMETRALVVCCFFVCFDVCLFCFVAFLRFVFLLFCFSACMFRVFCVMFAVFCVMFSVL